MQQSPLDQKELRQLEGVALDNCFVDKASGKDLHRPQLEQLTGYVREGDTSSGRMRNTSESAGVGSGAGWLPLSRL